MLLFFPVKTSDIGSKWFGESEQNIKNLFEEARRHPVSVIFFDEFEALGSKKRYDFNCDEAISTRVIITNSRI